MQTLSLEQQQLQLKLQIFYKQSKNSLQNALSKNPAFTSVNLQEWLREYAFNRSPPNIIRIDQFHQIQKIINELPEDKKSLQSELFSSWEKVIPLVDCASSLMDLAFINQKATAFKRREDHSDRVLDAIQKKFQYLMDKIEGQTLSYTQNLNFFIAMKLSNSKPPPGLLSQSIHKRQWAQIPLCYQWVLKPLFQKKSLKQFYHKLSWLASWLVLIRQEEYQLVYDLGKKINSYVVYRKKQDSEELGAVANVLFELLAIRFPLQSKLRHTNLSALLIHFENRTGVLKPFFQLWIQTRNNPIENIDFPSIFRTLGNLGFTGQVLQLLMTFWNCMVQIKKYSLLLSVFSNYIRKQFTHLNMRDSDDLNRYLLVIKHFMIGLCNRDRFEGEEIDQLTFNITRHAIRSKFSLSLSARKIIQVYSMYQWRFGSLSETSKRFLIEMQIREQYKLQAAQLHIMQNQFAIREAWAEEEVYDHWQEQQKSSKRYRGLCNMGNTCYLNAFMQALYMTKKFRTLIHNFTNEGRLPSSKLQVYALHNLYDELSRKDFDELQAFRPQYFRLELPEPFRSSDQMQDAAQFGRIYLESLAAELDGEDKRSLQRLLVQTLKKSKHCLKCKSNTSKNQSVFDLILTVKKEDNQIFLSKLIQNYFSSERFTDQNRLQCVKCNTRTDSLTTFEPLRFSDFIVFTLSIFQYSNGQGKKILLPFNFEFSIDLGHSLQYPILGEYELYAFIVHQGSVSYSGHYICYARNLQQNPMLWYCMDDGYVSERIISRPQEFNFSEHQTPYILFYSKKGNNASRIVKTQQSP